MAGGDDDYRKLEADGQLHAPAAAFCWWILSRKPSGKTVLQLLPFGYPRDLRDMNREGRFSFRGHFCSMHVQRTGVKRDK